MKIFYIYYFLKKYSNKNEDQLDKTCSHEYFDDVRNNEQLQNVNDEQEQFQDINEDMVTDDNESQVNEILDSDFPNYEYNEETDDISDLISNLSVEGK